MSQPVKQAVGVSRRCALKALLALSTMTLLSGLSGCNEGDEGFAAPSLQPGDTIVAFGDSLTSGKGVTRDKAYPALLQTLSGHTVINAGVSGETTARGRRRLPSVLAEHNPKLVILFEGGNDVLRNVPSAETKANLDAMITDIQATGAKVVLVAVPERSLFLSAAPWYEELADQYDLPLQDTIITKLLKSPSMKSDRVHFNEEGYLALAEALHELLIAENVY